MKKLNLLFIALLALNQCNVSNTENKAKSVFEEAKQEPTELIGNPLKTTEDRGKELNIKFDFLILETYTLDINNDGKEDEIIIEKIKGWNDPGDFHRIRIKSQGNEFVFFNSDGWVEIGEYETQFLNSFPKTNIVSSKYIIVQKASDKDILLFAFGYVYASQPGLLSILNLSSFDKPVTIFNDNFYLYSYEDKNGDGTIDIDVTKHDKDEISNKADYKTYLLKNGCYHTVDTSAF